MSDEPDFATFEKAPLEAYKTLFEKFLKAEGDNKKVCRRYLELSDVLEETKDKLEALHAVAGDNSVLNDSNPEAEISILNDNMAAQGAFFYYYFRKERLYKAVQMQKSNKNS